MKIDVEWYDEAKTILLQRFYDGWTAEDYYTTFARSAELLKQDHGLVRGIFTDCTQDGLPPRNMMAGYKKALTYGKLPFVMVSAHPVSRMLFETIRKAYKLDRAIYYAQSLLEAEEILNQHYAQLSAQS